MKNMKWIMSAMVAFALFAILVQSCKKDDEPVVFSLSSLTAGGVDLNGASSATGVPVDGDIVAGFSTDVDGSTANATNITLVREYDSAPITLTVTSSGKTVTISPDAPLGNGTLYELSMSGLKSSDGQSLSAVTRTFTTIGTFVPVGQVAHWGFEDNANDDVGNYDPAASDIVAITYNTSHSTVAGKAASFDGDVSIIEVPDGPSLMNVPQFTLSFWVYANTDGHVDANGNPAGFFTLGCGFFKGFQWEMSGDLNSAKFAAQYDIGGGLTTGSDLPFNGDGKTKDNGGYAATVFCKDLTTSGGTAALLKDKWAHIVVVYDGTINNRYVYCNGELMRQDDLSLLPSTDAISGATALKFDPLATDVGTKLAFGFSEDRASTLFATEPWGAYTLPTSNHFKGMLDDIRIFHAALTAQEIKLIYDSEK